MTKKYVATEDMMSEKETATTTEQALRDRVRTLEIVLGDAEHFITTLHGLTATDGLGAFGEALAEGCDTNGAWDCFVAGTWKIDETKVLGAIRDALTESPELLSGK